MKTLSKAGVSAVIAFALAAGLALPASADNTAKVDPGEYNQIRRGMSLAQVKAITDSAGKVTLDFTVGSKRYQFREWKVTTSSSIVATADVDFKQVNGKWKVDEKSVWWAFQPKQTSDKATRTEYSKVTRGKTYDAVKKAFGTKGTISYQRTSSNGTQYMDVLWPVANEKYGEVMVGFKRVNGVWRAQEKEARWVFSPKQITNKATKAEFSRVTKGMKLDAVKKAFGTNGTTSYHRTSTSGAQTMEILWPVPGSKYGEVEIDFKKVNGVWRVSDKRAYWG